MTNQPDQQASDRTDNSGETSRRRFLRGSVVGVGAFSAVAAAGLIRTHEVAAEVPDSEGYLVVDSEMCTNCKTCMLTCSSVNEGEASLSKARLQVTEDPHGVGMESSRAFPHDIEVNQCRQCEEAPCVDVCPTNALYADEESGNVRQIEQEKCVGCRQCIEACPVVPTRITWTIDDQVAQKCDLCTKSPNWDQEGGVDGDQACVEVCPMGCIEYTEEKPTQVGDEGYDVNLKRENWQENFAVGVDGEEPP
ncbi:4Fe-4S dicluster domain-containing protein [Salinarchaeum sp. IM2453]|uniref:4Fe-4S dicluster domain-containing protein n=1 Tax=Salinarchaeum sp. IM2453 TaxID=2862870 RepID=UPI001C82AF18|nr:4Fe-4S dicluster domain-containing protein [Salinarchaeum sp. IM2453]QZA88203.1 4Fe-4S dicluster domain-containing protein [Salinarchaeum sp. IM2453]